jgi:hypothetical protein
MHEFDLHQEKLLNPVYGPRGLRPKNSTDYNDDETRAFVVDCYRRDIELFGYAFGVDAATTPTAPRPSAR